MDIRHHIGRRLAAVAVLGGAATVLFTGTAAQTQFSASLNKNVVIKGATVAESVTGGTFTCSGLVPPNNSPELGSNPPATYNGASCNQNVSFTNTGSIPESFDITLGTITGSASATTQLNQLVFTVGGTSYSYAEVTAVGNPFHVATIAPGASLTAPFSIGLMPETGDPAVQNAWNGATIDIPYTVTATPSAS